MSALSSARAAIARMDAAMLDAHAAPPAAFEQAARDYADAKLRAGEASIAAIRADGAEAGEGTVEQIARDAAKPVVSGTGRMGAPHLDRCTCSACTERKVHQAEGSAKLCASIDLEQLRSHLETMLGSAEVYVDEADTITGYKIKTGALHRIIGFFAGRGGKGLPIPANLPVVAPPAARRGCGDVERLDWLLRHLRGNELRNLGIVWPAYSLEAARAAIDAALQPAATPESNDHG